MLLLAVHAALALSVGPSLRAGCTPRAACIVASESDAKSSLLAAIADVSLAVAPSSDRQMEVSELVLSMSAANPTAEPAKSPLLNGKWTLAYSQPPPVGITDSPTRLLAIALYAAPLSPSVIAQGLAKVPFDAAKLGEQLTVTIVSPEAGQPRVTAETTLSLLGGAPQPVVLRANLQARAGASLREDFIEAEVLGQRSLLPGPLAQSRSLYVTYLDEDMLIVRDESGLPSILSRAERFTGPFASEPSYDMEDSAPGI